MKLLIRLAVGILSLPLALFSGWTIVAENRFGGEPFTIGEVKPAAESVAAIAQAPAVNLASVVTPSTAQKPPSPAAGKTVTIIDGSSGKRQSILVPN